MLTTKNCDLFKQEYFQFAQLKKYCPERIEALKAEYKSSWQTWKNLNLLVSENLPNNFIAPHIESWSNGWQLRAHFFAYFKYEIYQNNAVIFSVLLNRRRLRVCLNWHSYRAKNSDIKLQNYKNNFQQLFETDLQDKFSDFQIWRNSDSEYEDCFYLRDKPILPLKDEQDFYVLGKHIEAENLAKTEIYKWIIKTINDLIPLYEICNHKK